MPEPIKIAWDLDEFVSLVDAFIALLRRHGLTPSPRSSLANAEMDLRVMVDRREGRILETFTKDRRPEWRRIVGLADIARKLLAVEGHENFDELLPHLRLMVDRDPQSLFANVPKENSDNDKLFELFVASSAMRFTTKCQVEESFSRRGKKRPPNPDFIGIWRNKRWGIACKALHSDHPETTIGHIRKGIEQIQRSGADAGLVIFNASNLLAENEMWPARQTATEWEYLAFRGVAAVNEMILNRQIDHLLKVCGRPFEHEFEDTDEGRFAAAGKGRHHMLARFSGTNVRPWMPLTWLSVVGHEGPGPGVICPAIYRLITTFSFADGPMDEETSDFQELLFLSAQGIEPTEENLAQFKSGTES